MLTEKRPGIPDSIWDITVASGWLGWLAVLVAFICLIYTIRSIVKKKGQLQFKRGALLATSAICIGLTGVIYSIYMQADYVAYQFNPHCEHLEWNVFALVLSWLFLIGFFYGTPLLIINMIFYALKSEVHYRKTAIINTIGISVICIGCLISAFLFEDILHENACNVRMPYKEYFTGLSRASLSMLLGVLPGSLILIINALWNWPRSES